MSDNNFVVNRNIIKNKPVEEEKSSVQVKPIDEFASAFPEWDLVPPAVVVKRIRRNI